MQKTVDKRLEELFQEFLGPIANTVFPEMKEKGLEKERVMEFINGLEEEDIITGDRANMFREQVNEIL